MTATRYPLAAGCGWRIDEVICTAGPYDRPFEERHDTVCIGAVMQGTFQYRTAQGSAVLAPGAVVLGNDGSCFECGHDHGTGDRSLSFHFAPDHLEATLADVPGVTRMLFTIPRLPPLPELLPLIAAVEAAREDGDAFAFEELALSVAAAVAAIAADVDGATPRSRRHDERRISEALRRIESEAHDQLTLRDLARGVAMSPYHFLRTFRTIVGTTPHQFLLYTRLRRAATRLRSSDDSVSAIAWDAGFNDLSTFNRRFRRMVGVNPGAYRAAGSGTPAMARPTRGSWGHR